MLLYFVQFITLNIQIYNFPEHIAQAKCDGFHERSKQFNE